MHLSLSLTCTPSFIPIFFIRSVTGLFAPLVPAAIALTLSIYSVTSCTLVNPVLFDFGNWFDFAPNAIGLFCFTTNDGTSYAINDFIIMLGGSKFEAAQKMGIAIVVLGSLAAVVALGTAGCGLLCVAARSPNTNSPPLPLLLRLSILMGTLLSLGTCLCQGLLFMVFPSDICELDCTLDTGGKAGVGAVVFWFLAAIVSFILLVCSFLG